MEEGTVLRHETKYLAKQLLKTVLERIRLLLQEVVALLGTDEAGLHAGKRPVCMRVKSGKRFGSQCEECVREKERRKVEEKYDEYLHAEHAHARRKDGKTLPGHCWIDKGAFSCWCVCACSAAVPTIQVPKMRLRMRSTPALGLPKSVSGCRWRHASTIPVSSLQAMASGTTSDEQEFDYLFKIVLVRSVTWIAHRS